MRSLLRNKQDSAWSPVSLLAIKPCCAQLHWNYPEYPLGQRLNFANTKRCNRPILPGRGYEHADRQLLQMKCCSLTLCGSNGSCTQEHSHAHISSAAFLRAAAHEPGFAGEFTFQKIRRCPTSKPCLGLELSFLHLSALYSCKLSSSSNLKTS